MKWSNLTSIFKVSWNHQPEYVVGCFLVSRKNVALPRMRCSTLSVDPWDPWKPSCHHGHSGEIAIPIKMLHSIPILPFGTRQYNRTCLHVSTRCLRFNPSRTSVDGSRTSLGSWTMGGGRRPIYRFQGGPKRITRITYKWSCGAPTHFKKAIDRGHKSVYN